MAASPDEMSLRLSAKVLEIAALRDTITSLGLGILMPGGDRLLRGPSLRIPEVPGRTVVDVGDDDRDAWADKGWVDLRPANFARWHKRFEAMYAAGVPNPAAGSDDVRLESYPFDSIEIGTVAAWVLANELGGYRIK